MNGLHYRRHFLKSSGMAAVAGGLVPGAAILAQQDGVNQQGSRRQASVPTEADLAKFTRVTMALMIAVASVDS